MPVDFYTAAAGAGIGALAGGSVTLTITVIKAQMDIVAARCDDVCKQIIAAADLSSEYWLLTVSSDLEISRTEREKEALEEAQLLEARLDGLLQQILLADEDLRSSLPASARESVKELLPMFIEALSGDEFKSRTGSPRLVNASLVQHAAANLVSAIRAGLRQRYTIGFLLKHWFHQH